MSHAFSIPAGRRSRGCQLRRRLFVPLCLLALTHFSFLFFTASAAEAPTAEAEVAVGEQVVDAKKPPVVKKESQLKKPEGEGSLMEETPVAAAGKRKLSGQHTKYIKAGAVAASAILFLLLFMRIAKRHEALEEKRRQAVETDRKELEAIQDLGRFKNTFEELIDDLAKAGDELSEMNYKIQQLTILATERIEKINEFEQKLKKE